MNTTFWLLMIVMLLLAIGMLVYPILKVRQSSSIVYKDSNLKINDEKIKELEQDLVDGRIDQVFYRVAREELDRELLIDIPAVNVDTASQHYVGTIKRHPALALVIAIFIPMLTLLLYLDLGMHASSNDALIASQPSTVQQPSIEKMTRQLEARIEKEGGTVKDWIMLARAHKHLGETSLAADAYAVALEKAPENAQLMLERAEMLALLNERVFNDESRSLVFRALELEPDNPNTLWFAGVAEYQQKNYHQAIDHLVRLLPMARTEEEVVKSIFAVVSNSRKALIASGEDMPELGEILAIKAMVDVSTAQTSKQQASTSQKTEEATGAITSVHLKVDVNEAVRQKFDANDIVFVYAKAKQGPRMPLAAKRVTLASLPAEIVLDDTMAMVEGMNLSAFDQLVISARVTKSASAISQSGDYIGQAEISRQDTDATKNAAINIIINERVE